MIDQELTNILSTKLPFWEKLNNSQKDLLVTNARPVHYSQEQSIHNGENECIGVLLVTKGIIRTYITSEEGRDITLFRLEAGDICILSASCILDSIDFDVSVDAETDCDIIQISSHIFSRLTAENVYAELFSYKLAAERFSDVMWAMQQILFVSFDKRLAGFLLDECNRQHTTELHMTHEQIAKYLGSAREVVSRMLKYFSKEGLVTLSRGTIVIQDKKELQSIL